MKRFLSYLLTFALVFALALSFASCKKDTDDQGGNQGNGHVHNFSGGVCADCGAEDPDYESKYSEGLEYTLSSDKTYYIVSGIGTCKDTNVVIPSEYNDLPVKTIDNSAFENCSNLTSITIPDSVTGIGDYAFSFCSSLVSITIPDSVTSIGSYAFQWCSSLVSITIPDNVTSIGFQAFRNCSSLTNITIPDSVTYIGDWAFYGCSKLVEVINHSSLDIKAGSSSNGYVAYYAKEVHTGESKIVNQDNYLFYTYDDVNYLLGYVGNDTELTLPESYNGESYEIYKYAFYNCSSLVSITIPDSVTIIGDKAFRDCDSLVSITIPDSVTSIGDHAFRDCGKLVEVINRSSLDIKAGSSNYGDVAYYAKEVHTGESKIVNQDNYLFYTYDDVNYLLGYVGNDTELILPESYNGESYEIYKHAFWGCANLTSITIPNSVTIIGDKAFYGCSGLTSVTIPDSVTSIGDWAFYGCSSLVSVTISNSVTSIGDHAFEDCSSLVSITIPDSVTNIGDCAFWSCASLTSITIPDSVISIGNSAFAYCSGLVSITIPDSVTSIGYEAFAGCSSLTSITIPDSVTSIGHDAFSGCSSLDSITIPDSVTIIGYDAFSGCNNLIQKENGVSYVDKWVIDCDTSIETVVLREGTVGIAGSAFAYCSTLTSITIPDSVTSIGDGAFYDCSSLVSITIPDSVTSIGDRAFYWCSNLKDVYYTGSEDDWAKISIGSENSPLTNAARHYNYVAEEA